MDSGAALYLFLQLRAGQNFLGFYRSTMEQTSNESNLRHEPLSSRFKNLVLVVPKPQDFICFYQSKKILQTPTIFISPVAHSSCISSHDSLFIILKAGKWIGSNMCLVPSSLLLEYTKKRTKYLRLNDGGVKQISQEPGRTSERDLH